eukprot:scpid87061/ scgid1043/ PR domain zinc finger protein 12; PR domain-containing protein 12
MKWKGTKRRLQKEMQGRRLGLVSEETPNLACPMLVTPDPNDVKEDVKESGETQSKEGTRIRYPRRRAASKVSYNEDESDDDEYIYCEDCDDWFRGDCPNCGPLQPLNSEAMGSKPVRSQHTFLLIPPEIRIGKSKIAGAGMGAFAKTFIPKGTRIGPYTGDVVEEDGLNPERDSSYMWEVWSLFGTQQAVYVPYFPEYEPHWSISTGASEGNL